MGRFALASTALLLCAGLAACSDPGSGLPDGATVSGDGSDSPGPDGQPAPTGFTVREVDTVQNPWAMTFLPGSDDLLITRQTGEFLLRHPDGETVTVGGTPDVAYAGQGGLGDVVVSPDFEQDRLVYLSWAQRGEGGTGAAVGRGRLDTGPGAPRLTDFETIWQQQPKTSGNGHFAHRMAFSPDGRHLFVTSGDRQKMEPAQDLDVTLGKVLRLDPDGSAAPDNPFVDRGGVATQIWTYGHRNPLGIAFDGDGNLWSSEMGPRGGDELNLIVAGRNYGWPLASQGRHYSGQAIPDHTAGDGFEAPKVFWNPSVSPGSLMLYDGDVWPQWRGDAFLGALSGQALIRVDLDGTDATIADRWDMGARIREVEQGPDGTIWLLEDGDAGRLLQLVPS